jgi:hypoxanthine phosphoribosyltransferase
MTMRLSEQPLFNEEIIQARVHELAREISQDYAGKPLVLASVLKGAAVFASDLLRSLIIPAELEFLRAKSYEGTESKGDILLHHIPGDELKNKDVLLVEDILDTGKTIAAVLEKLRAHKPASLAVCVLLDKPHQRETDVIARYVGFTLDPRTKADDLFVVGYGLDYNESYRGLRAIHTLHEMP